MNESAKPNFKVRTCPHCGKTIPKLPIKPRDLGLLLHWLVYSVPCDATITENLIQAARKHCRMTPERLAVLRAEPHARHWPRMHVRRAARLTFFRQNGRPPLPGMPLLPGEPARFRAMDGYYRYRKGGLAKLKARLRKHPNGSYEKLANLYLRTKRLKSPSRKSAALDDVFMRFLAAQQAGTGKLTLAEYEELRLLMRPDKEWWRRLRRERRKMRCGPENPNQKTRGEPQPEGSAVRNSGFNLDAMD
jgi:hypothetical protein